jgi:hypothetical protein
LAALLKVQFTPPLFHPNVYPSEALRIVVGNPNPCERAKKQPGNNP